MQITPANILLIIVGGGFLGFFVTRFLSSKVNVKTQILNALHKFKSKQIQGNIKHIESKQNTIKVKLNEDASITDQAKNKIKKIQKKAAEDIEAVLKEENITKIHKEIESSWQDI